MTSKPYCVPNCTSPRSQPKEVAKVLAKLFDALDGLDATIVSGKILGDKFNTWEQFRDQLQAEGWLVTSINGSLVPTGHWQVYPPGSPTGAKILKWIMEARAGREG